LPSKQRIQSQIKQFLAYNYHQRHPVQIAFFGGNFLGLQKDQIQSLLEATHSFLSSGDVAGIRFSTRPDTIDKHSLAIIRDFPVATIELGVQSMNDKVLAISKRGHSACDAKRAMGILRKESYEVGLQMMVGLPGESETGVLISGSKIAELKPDFVRIYPTTVLKNSELARWYQQGLYTPFSLNKSVSLVKQLYLMFQKKRIPVVRMGLQASADLDQGGGIIAGPYHPSFGHLVLSAIMLDRIKTQIKESDAIGDKIKIIVHPRSISQVQGLNKQNLNILKKQFNLHTVSLLADKTLSPDQVQLVSIN
jgi:histone acetyltransferase (RNA polymerase elongator complex component)